METKPIEKAFLINFLQFTGIYLYGCLELQNNEIDVSKYVSGDMLSFKDQALKKLNENATKRIGSILDAFFKDYSFQVHCCNNLFSIKRGIGGPPLDYIGYSKLPEFRDLWQVLTERCKICPYSSIRKLNSGNLY